MSASAMKMAARFGFVALGMSLAIAPASSVFANQPPELQGDAAPVAAPAKPVAKAADSKANKAVIAKGRELFSNWGCSSCHSLADAQADGHVGPAFDGDTNLSVDYVINRVTNGQGAMPSFGGQMTDDEIKTIAKYITSVAQH